MGNEQVVLSLWLPITPTDFYDRSSNAWLVRGTAGEAATVRSRQLEDPRYVPILSTSVFRRLLEVLPRSFGYDTVAVVTASEGPADPRPISLGLRLRLDGLALLSPHANRANLGLSTAGATDVLLRVDEYGFYTFQAEFSVNSDAERVKSALLDHIREVFGGDFAITHRQGDRIVLDDARTALRRYNGQLGETGGPIGVLTLAQLRRLMDGLLNAATWPEVFFTQDPDLSFTQDTDDPEAVPRQRSLMKDHAEASHFPLHT